ncbi:hypothetical protein BgiMline_029814 [Biomphalaria glabrata]|uniref:Uncharacterized protein LOC106073535 n=1 Tax=Biomphalaria glabrata TaxID=6526 RepID=A0A9U8EIZ1_BIOGL|nr:uncharacterized protein LOC106073535 [Biomphalaria glabrata]KAI8736279.1 hypothetical protein BgiMline_026531 [Biomphalaria glabrata]
MEDNVLPIWQVKAVFLLWDIRENETIRVKVFNLPAVENKKKKVKKKVFPLRSDFRVDTIKPDIESSTLIWPQRLGIETLKASREKTLDYFDYSELAWHSSRRLGQQTCTDTQVVHNAVLPYQHKTLVLNILTLLVIISNRFQLFGNSKQKELTAFHPSLYNCILHDTFTMPILIAHKFIHFQIVNITLKRCEYNMLNNILEYAIQYFRPFNTLLDIARNIYVKETINNENERGIATIQFGDSKRSQKELKSIDWKQTSDDKILTLPNMVTRVKGISRGGPPLLPSPHQYRTRPILANPWQQTPFRMTARNRPNFNLADTHSLQILDTHVTHNIQVTPHTLIHKASDVQLSLKCRPSKPEIGATDHTAVPTEALYVSPTAMTSTQFKRKRSSEATKAEVLKDREKSDSKNIPCRTDFSVQQLHLKNRNHPKQRPLKTCSNHPKQRPLKTSKANPGYQKESSDQMQAFRQRERHKSTSNSQLSEINLPNKSGTEGMICYNYVTINNFVSNSNNNNNNQNDFKDVSGNLVIDGHVNDSRRHVTREDMMGIDDCSL